MYARAVRTYKSPPHSLFLLLYNLANLIGLDLRRLPILGILTEPEYVKRQEVRRGEQEALQTRKSDLEGSIAAQRDLESLTEAIPVKLRSFLEDFRDMDVRQAKAILQGIIRAIRIYSDSRVELKFRN